MNNFGIQLECLPRKCTNTKCSRQFCAQCIQQIQTYNGDDRPFQCMFCLQIYRKNVYPEENQLLIKQLWEQAVIQYGIERTRDLLTKDCTSDVLNFDIDCRRRHLMNLIRLYKHYCHRTQLLLTAEYLVNQLTQYLQEDKNDNLEEYQNIYRGLISETPRDADIGLLYISLCERFQHEIFEAEYSSMFPKTNKKILEWLQQQGSAKEFTPKLLDLFEILEQDLINHWSDPAMSVRTKIGVIGYTSTGKSSLINCLNGIQCLTEDNAAPVSNNRSTYFPLQFDRKEPLINPDYLEEKTLVTFVDIQGVDRQENLMTKTDFYLDEIFQADCDIYMLVSDQILTDEEQRWMDYIEEILKRKCLLIRSKMDIPYLNKFQEFSGISYSKADRKQRKHYDGLVRDQLRKEYSLPFGTVYFIACDYCPTNADAISLLQEQAFDYVTLLNDLGRLAVDAYSYRLHALANRILARAMNTIFRRGYVLNVMKYKIAAGFASIIPFGDQLPRYLSRDSIREAFGLDEDLRKYLMQYHLVVYNYKLQTSIFEDCVEIREVQINSKFDAKWLGRAAGTAFIVGGSLTDDVLRIAGPTAVAVSGAARVAFTVATIGIGVIISAGVSAWSAVDSGKHIFSYINRTCDDIIMISHPLIMSIIERERTKKCVSTNNTMMNE